MKPAGKPFVENIAPDAACAMGPVAGHETRLDRCDELRVMDLAGAGRAVEPGVDAGPRDLFLQRCDLGQIGRHLPILDLSRFRSGDMVMFSGLLFDGRR